MTVLAMLLRMGGGGGGGCNNAEMYAVLVVTPPPSSARSYVSKGGGVTTRQYGILSMLGFYHYNAADYFTRHAHLGQPVEHWRSRTGAEKAMR